MTDSFLRHGKNSIINQVIIPDRIALVIFACNEADVISETIRKVRESMKSSDSLFVVADNCDDETAEIARSNGAQVMVRKDRSSQGKGAALSWFAEKYQTTILAHDFLVILDADSLVLPDFIQELKERLTENDVVSQCRVAPIGYHGSSMATLIALSEIIEQSVFDHIRSKLRLSIRLRGTGMIFKPDILIQLCPYLKTDVEDVALSLLLADKGITVKSLSTPRVYDPKPTHLKAASRQRARWFRGQWNSLWHYRAIVFKLIMKGPLGWSMLSSLFLKPRWLKFSFLILLGLVFWQIPFISWVLLVYVLLEILAILIGIIFQPDRLLFIKSFFHFPVFLSMWVKGILLSLKPNRWLRVREFRITKRDYETEASQINLTSKNI